MLDDDEGKLAFQWLCQKWSANLHYFLPTVVAANKEARKEQKKNNYDDDTLFD